MKPVLYVGLIAAVLILGALSILPAFAEDVQATPPDSAMISPTHMANLTLTLTDDGILGAPEQTPAGGGLYLLTVKNDSSGSRGIVMKGVDLCCSPYTRFVKVLRPGEQISFRWYFPSDRTVQFRDLLQCKPMARTCGAPRVGSLTSSVQFGQPA